MNSIPPSARTGRGSVNVHNPASDPVSRTLDSLKQEMIGCEFPFSNIAIEGGGSKGNAILGAIRVLEELGYWDKITRFAGASAGSMVATLMCIGYNSHDIERFLCGDIQSVFLDARFGVFSYLPNILMNFGLHPGKKIHKWFGDKIKQKMGDPDLTFAQLYHRTGKELCITVTNMNLMDCEYCHVKTTPDMPIRQAVRMSACIPGVFCPVKVKSGSAQDYCVDGGLLCNYPVHCYDGWYLSMKREDSFLNRFENLAELPKLWDAKERFGEKNDSTFGILLYSGGEREVLKDELNARIEKWIKPGEVQEIPDTPLAKKRTADMKKRDEKAGEHRLLVQALFRFKKVLWENDTDKNDVISLDEFQRAMNQKDSEFTDEDKKLLFGDNFRDTKALFKQLDIDGDKNFTFRELLKLAEKRGIDIMENFRGYSRQDIRDLSTFFGSIMESLLLNMKRVYIQSSDLSRTVGINTGYIDTLDFDMKKPDQNYLVEQGKLGCVAFLRELIAEGKMVRKT